MITAIITARITMITITITTPCCRLLAVMATPAPREMIPQIPGAPNPGMAISTPISASPRTSSTIPMI